MALKHVGQRFAAGHRLRLALSSSYWPVAWAPPEPVTLTVYTDGCRVLLPVRAPRPDDDFLPPFADAAGAQPLRTQEIKSPVSSWRAIHDLSRNTHALEIAAGIGTIRLPDIDLTVGTDGFEQYTVRDHEPASQRGETRWKLSFSRDAWDVSTVTQTTLTCDGQSLFLTAELTAYESGQCIYEHKWQRKIRRKCM